MMRGILLASLLAVVFASRSAFAIGFCSSVATEKKWDKPLEKELKEQIASVLPKNVYLSMASHLEKLNYLIEKEGLSAYHLQVAQILKAKDPQTLKEFDVLKVGRKYFYFANDFIPGLEVTGGESFGPLKTAHYALTKNVQKSFKIKGRGQLLVGPKTTKELLQSSEITGAEFLNEILSYAISDFQREFVDAHKEQIVELFQTSKNGVEAHILQDLRKAMFIASGKEVYMVDSNKTKWIFDQDSFVTKNQKPMARLQDVNFSENGGLVVIGEAKTYFMEKHLGFSEEMKLKDLESEYAPYLNALKYSLDRAFGRKLSPEELSAIASPILKKYPGAYAFYPVSMVSLEGLRHLHQKLSQSFTEKEVEIIFTQGYLGFVPPSKFLANGR
ncbi:MAG: hypothetical protein VX642_01745 [Bdellovibrionota bacterium]|nr:hypothetical protein [Bdellovibrionota bacterium]